LLALPKRRVLGLIAAATGAVLAGVAYMQWVPK
jgi:hypothetical protein